MTNNVVWHTQGVSKEERSQVENQESCLICFTGLSGWKKAATANPLDL
ncbi:MAG: adenylylsulfate kinase [Oleiphilaceae bacterium]|jgi:adenylylsulfate kinase-like enzyme